jgi:hypothetical protein
MPKHQARQNSGPSPAVNQTDGSSISSTDAPPAFRKSLRAAEIRAFADAIPGTKTQVLYAAGAGLIFRASCGATAFGERP